MKDIINLNFKGICFNSFCYNTKIYKFASIHLLAFNLFQIRIRFASNTFNIHFKFVSHSLQIHLEICFIFQKQLFAGVLQYRCFFKENGNIERKTTVPESLLSKVTGLQPATLFNKRLSHRGFPMIFYEVYDLLEISEVAVCRRFAKLVLLKILQNS